MVEGGGLPTRDQEIAEHVKRFLSQGSGHYLVLVDDLEDARRNQVEAIFARYRTAVELKLASQDHNRVAVGFLVNMLEAYYFAHAAVINDVLSLNPPLEDEPGNVEDIRHPKKELQRRCRDQKTSFREQEHGGRILERLDLVHVLSRPETCGWLRAVVGWMVAEQ